MVEYWKIFQKYFKNISKILNLYYIFVKSIEKTLKMNKLFIGGKIMIDINDLANEFLSIEPMTQKKIQKLCYYAQAWYIALTDNKLYNDELQAWIHGPVSPKLYERFKGYGYNKIPKKISTIQDSEIQEFVQQIYRIYGNLDGDQLEELTHQEKPWKNAREGKQPYEASNNEISIKDMADYFKEKIRQEEAYG